MFDLKNKTKNKLPKSSSFFKKVKNKILGKNYELSLVLVGEETSRKINRDYKKKDKSANILSFPIDKNTGEILISPKKVKKEAKEHSLNYEEFFTYLFIHGLLHLKGLGHGKKMQKEEKLWLSKLKIPKKSKIWEML